MKRYICILLCVVFAFVFLCSCEKSNKTVDISEEKVESSEAAVSGAESQIIDEDKFLISMDEKPLPPFSEKKQTAYEGSILTFELNKYIEQLVDYGFTHTKFGYPYHHDYFEKDDLCTYIRKKDVLGTSSTLMQCIVSYAKRPSGERKNAVSAEDVKSLLGIGNIGLIEIYVPELFEKMQAQLFAIPENGEILLVKDKKIYASGNTSASVAGAIPGSISPVGDFLVCDINKDNAYELLYVSEGDSPDYSTETQMVSVVCFKDDKAVVRHCEPIDTFLIASSYYYDISTEKESDSDVITRYYVRESDASGSYTVNICRARVELADDKVNLVETK